MKNRRILKALLLAVLFAVFLVMQMRWDALIYYHPDKIKEWLAEAGSLAPVVYMLVMALAVATPLPTIPLDIVAGAFFGPFWGTLYSATGALGGAVISFMIARLLGRELIERFLHGHINFCTACSDRLLTIVIFLTRLIPVISFDLVSYGAGLTKISLKKFSLATFLGMLPLTFVYNYFGSFLVIGKRLAVAMGLVMVLLFFLIPPWIERYAPLSVRRLFQHQGEDTIGEEKRTG